MMIMTVMTKRDGNNDDEYDDDGYYVKGFDYSML